ncbi:hypothetical protein SAMN04487781_1922 [Cellulosimicrobium cellulans]|nr:hypothetical protein SAMN04487781_1922 [Cellulosimicrobium cellulans]
MTDPYYYSDDVAILQVLLEEVTRAKPGSPESRFVRPEGEVVDRLASRFHHALYGRRGTGKSSLLRHIESNLRSEGRLVAWADQETFKGLSYPDVLVSALAEIFQQFASQLAEVHPEIKRKWYQIRKPALTTEQALVRELRQAVASLLDLKRAPSESEVEWTESYSSELMEAVENGTNFGGSTKGASAEHLRKRGRSSRTAEGAAIAHRYTASKAEHLERALSTYRVLMNAVGKIAPDSYVILDDFYHLREADQPNIAGYFHRAVKDTGVWLKFGSIALWTRLYAGGSPPTGLQAPHDVRELSLDRGLQQFPGSKRFLEKILAALADECNVKIPRLFSDGALDRLVLASGGVPRDYIGLVSESIAAAKNRGPSAKSGSERVIAEDVNQAAGRTVETKFNDMREDAGGESNELQKLVIDLTNHCRNSNSACFLVSASDVELVAKVNRLQNMRFVHAIASNETLPNQQSERYHVYVLDVSQLAAQRAWQVDFMGWTKREGRRARKLVFPPMSGAFTADPSSTEPEIAQDDARAVVGDVD